MPRSNIFRPLACVSAAVTAGAASLGGTTAAAHAQGTVTLSLVRSGAMTKVGSYAPLRLKLSPEKPASVAKAPADLKAPLYGVISLGGDSAVAAAKPTLVSVILDEPENSPSRLFVDSNANGDLTDDPPAKWATESAGGQTMSNGSAMVPLMFSSGAKAVPVGMGFYRFDKKDPKRAAVADSLFYFRDYANEGTVTLGGKTYKVVLDDIRAQGSFDKPTGITLLIDVNGNGKFEGRGERYDAAKPFNIAGTTYELKNIAPSGASFTIAKSAQTVAEVVPPPNLGQGKSALPFTVRTTDRREVAFPASYKGKLVLLDFWATWCGPCIGELPNVIAAYNKYNSQGFEILGISLDREGDGPKLASFTHDKGMPWPQVYDGKYWEAAIAVKYGVQSIPAAYLVEGDTGRIIASGDELRGGGLAKILETVLAKRKTASRTP